MVDAREFVRIEGTSVDVRVLALVETIVGTVLLGYFYGLIDAIESIGLGVSGAIRDLASYLFARTGLVGSTFGIVEDAIAVAWRSNIAFVSSLGTLGIVVAMIEVVVLIWLVLSTASIIGSSLSEGVG
jgi:hypothetical protein